MIRLAANRRARLPLALAAAILGYFAVIQDLAYTVRGSAAEAAHVLAPHDGRIAALLSQELSQPGASLSEQRAADEIARGALIEEPTAVPAVTTLGLSAERRGDSEMARRALTFAQTLSRRDFRTQVWAVQTAVARNDVAAAIANYDIALRTSKEASDLMFPVLAAAIARPEIRAALAVKLGSDPPWRETFVDYLVANDGAPDVVAAFFFALDDAHVPVPPGARVSLIDALAARGLLGTAWRQYSRLHPGATRTGSRDPHFRQGGSVTSIFDWRTLSAPGLSAAFERGSDGSGVFAFTAQSAFSGVMLQQTTILPPGSYELVGHGTIVDEPEITRSYWLLTCSGGRELGRIALSGRFGGRLVVPDGCPAQTLSLVARASDGARTMSGSIDTVALRPIR